MEALEQIQNKLIIGCPLNAFPIQALAFQNATGGKHVGKYRSLDLNLPRVSCVFQNKSGLGGDLVIEAKILPPRFIHDPLHFSVWKILWFS